MKIYLAAQMHCLEGGGGRAGILVCDCWLGNCTSYTKESESRFRLVAHLVLQDDCPALVANQ